MLKDVKKILIEWRELTGGCKVILLEKDKDTVSLDDLSAFVFRNSNGKLHDYSPFDDRLKRIVTKYNSTHEDVDRLPDISCHTFRHSFCCWLCENTNGTNSADDIKYIQSVMGHADISTTLNIYSELRKGNQENKHTALKKKAKES
jgi:integrase